MLRRNGFPVTVRFGVVSTHTSPPCGLARFTAGLAGALGADGLDAGVVWVADGPPFPESGVTGDSVDEPSVVALKALLGQVDVAILQHDEATTGDEVVGIIDGLRVPSIVVVHTIPEEPTSHQRSVLEAIGATADHLVVMSEAARERLYSLLCRRPPKGHDDPARCDLAEHRPGQASE